MTSISFYLSDTQGWRGDAAYCSVSPEIIPELEIAAQELLQNRALLARLEDCRSILLDDEQWDFTLFHEIPAGETLAERYFMVFPILHALKDAKLWFKTRSIPENILKEGLRDLQLWIDEYKKRHLVNGFETIEWLRLTLMGRVFRLGRLQFEPAQHRYPVAVFQNLDTAKVVLVATDGYEITDQGIYTTSEGSNGTSIKIEFESGDQLTKAHVISDKGYISTTPDTFDPLRWRRLLTLDDAVLVTHIPAGEPLNTNACLESFAAAKVFFAKYFADSPPPRAFTCGSWLLYPRLSEILSGGNIVGFQQLFKAFPTPGACADQAFERVFPRQGRKVKPHHLTSSLQRSLYQHVQNGGIPLISGGLRLID